MSRNKWWLISGTVLAAVLMVSIIFVINQSPLKVNGITRENEENKAIILEVINKGDFDIQLVEVMVNNNNDLQKVELGVSHSFHAVAGGGLDEDPDIKFVPITEHKIKPDLTPEERTVKLESKDYPIHFGIRLFSNEPIIDVKVKYKYFGFTYTKTMTLDEWPQSNF